MVTGSFMRLWPKASWRHLPQTWRCTGGQWSVSRWCQHVLSGKLKHIHILVQLNCKNLPSAYSSQVTWHCHKSHIVARLFSCSWLSHVTFHALEIVTWLNGRLGAYAITHAQPESTVSRISNFAQNPNCKHELLKLLEVNILNLSTYFCINYVVMRCVCDLSG